MTLATAIQTVDFDHPFMIVDGLVADAPGNVYAPYVYHSETDDIDIEQLPGDGWQAIKGFTGQYSYHGSVMHPSEYIGDAIADHLREIADENRETVFVIVSVDVLPDDEDDDPEPAGWTVLYRTSE